MPAGRESIMHLIRQVAERFKKRRIVSLRIQMRTQAISRKADVSAFDILLDSFKNGQVPGPCVFWSIGAGTYSADIAID